MKAAIRFIKPDDKLSILTKLLDIIQGVEQLRQHILHGILLEKLTPSEGEALKRSLTKLGYPHYTATENSLRLTITGGDLGSLIPLVITIPGFGNDFAEMFWERGFSIENLAPDQAEDLKRRLEAIAIVTITPDIADTPEPVVYSVSGQVRAEDNTPFTESGFTVHVLDSISHRNPVPLGSVALSPQGSYHLSYAWQPDGRSGPNLVVRLVNSQGETGEEVRASLASAQAVLNITVKKVQPQSFVLTAQVKNPATGKVLPNVQVEAQFRANNTTLRTNSGTTNSKGATLIPLDDALFKNVPNGQSVEVVFGVRREGQTLETNTTIPNLQPKNQEVEVLVSVPDSTGEAFNVYGTIRWTGETLAPGLTVRAFDAAPRGNPVLLGSAVPDAKGDYRISYSWTSDGRNGPDLIVRAESDGKTISEERRQFATRNEIVNLTVEDSEKKTITIKGRAERRPEDTASPASPGNISGLLIEAWDKYEILSEPLGKGETDQEGSFTITLIEPQVRELFLGRRPDVFFSVSDGKQVLLNTRNSIIHNISEIRREVVLELPSAQIPDKPSRSDIPLPLIRGTAVLSPGWENDVLIEAFADAELKQPLGMAKVSAGGRFEIRSSSPSDRLWFRWSQGKKQGQSPTLQPFNIADPIRLHVFERYPVIPISKEMDEASYKGAVRSISGRPVIGTAVYLLEVALRRCQVLGSAVTDQNGVYRISYNTRTRFNGKPDLRVVVRGSQGIWLVESDAPTVILPGRVAGTLSLYNRVAEVLGKEGIQGTEGLQLTIADIDYIAARSGLPRKAIDAYAAASSLARQLKMPRQALFALLNSDNAADPRIALEQAVEQDDVSPSILRELPEITGALLATAQDKILTKDLGRGSIDDFLSLQIPDPAARKEIAKLMLDAPTGAELRAKLKERGILSSGLDLLLVIQSLIGVDVPLARVLSRSSGSDGIDSLQSKTREQWEGVLNDSGLYDEGVDSTGNTVREKRRTHARILKQRAEQLDPMIAFRNQIKQHSGSQWAAHIGKYLDVHPDFDLDGEKPAAGPQDASAVEAIGAYKRVKTITEAHGPVGVLLDHGFMSARSIARVSSEEFTETVLLAFDGNRESVLGAHSRAVRKTAALNVASSFLPLDAKASLCGCSLCKSVFGPAAYLFELLLFLNRHSLLGHFKQHRPDVPHLRLSCPNTNIEVPQIDLVNEALEDLMLEPADDAVGRGLVDGNCLPDSRETKGTSEERRAVPQNEPSPAALALLGQVDREAVLPWSLPYDYELDRARSASAILIPKPEDMALELWRYESTAPDSSIAAANTALGRSLLSLNDEQVGLIVKTSSLASAWGSTVASEVAGSDGLNLWELKRFAGLSSADLESVLDTVFVRGVDDADGPLRLDPEDLCRSDEDPRLIGTVGRLTSLLDRFHRFERVRRQLDWSIHEMDEALRWLSGTLNVQRLEQIGILRFLELKLGVTPERLLALLRDPVASSTPTLRPRIVLSPFERLFGANSSQLDVSDVTSAQLLTAKIAQISGESLATVDLAFSRGVLAPWLSASAMLSSSDLQSEFRRAVCAVYRLSQWAGRLGIQESELVDLVQLAKLEVMPASNHPTDPQRQLLAALQLVDLAGQKRSWPVGISEIRYLIGDDPAAIREHGATATEVGRQLSVLRQELRASEESQKPIPLDAHGAVRTLLSRLLLSTASEGDPAIIEAKVQELAHQLEWSAFFPDLGARFSQALSQMLPEWPGLSDATPPGAADSVAKLATALDSLEQALQDWLTQRYAEFSVDSATLWSDESFQVLVTSLRTGAIQALQEPNLDTTPAVQANLAGLFEAAGLTLPPSAVVSISRQLSAKALEHVRAWLAPQLLAQAGLLLPLLEVTMKRMTARKVLAEWITRSQAVEEATATVLLDSLSDPRDGAHSIVRAFVTDDGVMTPDLERSVVTARYLEAAETVSHPGDLGSGNTRLQQAQPFQETSLAFDWSERAPQPGLHGRRFAAVMEVPIPVANLFENGEAITLVVETDGQALVEIDVDGVRRTLVDFDAGGAVARSSAAVAEYAGLDPTREVVLHIRYISTLVSRSKTFKFLKLSSDGQHDEFQWALMAEAILKVTKIALGLRGVSVPISTWGILRDAAIPARVMALDQLSSNASLETWLRIFALNDLAKRIRSGQSAAWLTLVAGGIIKREDLQVALNLEQTELAGTLQLLGAIDSLSDAIKLPIAISLEHFAAALRLTDRARRLGLPAAALKRWNHATPAEIYQWALAALRRGLEPSEWLKLLAEIYDPVRASLRDAQLDYLMAHPRRGSKPFTSREALSDYLLTDVQMSPCMVTSRIQFSYAAVQKYVDLALSGRLPGPAPSQKERFVREWIRLSNYRLSEAQLRIKLNPENWIEPEIRPTKTPIWEDFEQRLQSEPLTLHLAEWAMREYMASLAEVSRLETIAIVTHQQPDLERPLAFRNTELVGTHVFARTRAYPRRLYYRRRLPKPDGRWTPWERIDQDMEGTHYLAVIAFGRVRLICAEFAVAKELRPDQCNNANDVNRSVAAAGSAVITDYEVSLSWIDREDRKWSPVWRSERLQFSLSSTNAPSNTDLWENRPRDQFPIIERKSASVVNLIYIEVRFGGDTIDPTSKMMVRLIDNAGNRYDIGEIKGQNSSMQPVFTDPEAPLPSNFDAEEIARVRLEWIPWTDGGRSDDCDLTGVTVFYMSGLSLIGSSEVIKGMMAQNTNEFNYPDSFVEYGVQCRFQGGGGLSEGGHGLSSDPPWRAFEGELSPRLRLLDRQPQPSDFHIEHEITPQSVDLSKALRIEASNFTDSSFAVQIHSVVATTQVRLRARFKVKDATFTAVPEAEGNWPADWVTSAEFCYPYITEASPLARLRIHADQTVQLEDGVPGEMAGTPPWTVPVGQKLIATALDPAAFEGQSPFGPLPFALINGGGNPVALTRLDYELVVPRNQPVSGESSPKILEELHSRLMAPARSFFIERLGEVPSRNENTGPTLTLLLADGGSEQARERPALTNKVDRKIKPVRDGVLVAPVLVASTNGTSVITHAVAVAIMREELRGQQFMDSKNSWDRAWDARFSYRSIWSFQTFWHPQAVGFRRILEARGLPRLMRIENQELGLDTDLVDERERVEYFSGYLPNQFVSLPWPKDEVDFTIDGPFSEYNWELFHDSLVYLTKLFDADGKFREADEIFSLLIDTARAGNQEMWKGKDPKFFRTAPIRHSISRDHDLFGAGGLIEGDEIRPEIIAQIERINQNPYQPHIIARGWPSIYAGALRIRLADHLIQAGEHHFRRAYQGDSRTDLELATTRFDFAVRVLGEPQDPFGMMEGDIIPCFSSLMHSPIDRPASGIEVLESYLPGNVLSNSILPEGTEDGAHVYFCVPRDEKLDDLRAQVADRLSKLRACQDIEGVRRALSLYGQRIDPALLVRATAEGVDLDVLLGRISSAKPTMYFSALWSRAMQACERARSLEEAWLGAQERADSEGMARLQNEQEIQTLEMGVEVGAQRLEDARLLVEALARTVESAQLRYDFYSTRERISQLEKAEGDMLRAAEAADARAAADARSASDWAWVPTVEVFAEAGAGYPDGAYARAGVSSRTRLGGETAVQVYRALAEGHRNEGAETRVKAGLIGQSAVQERRFDEWKLNALLAQKDIAKGERDKAGAEVRTRIADLELQLQKKRVEDATVLRTYMKEKFSNQQLYSWRASRLQQLRYQQQQIAYDLAAQAKSALARELGLENQVPFFDKGTDSTLAAASLSVELERMQQIYVTTKRSERKKTKAYSLATRQPLAFLELLQRGETVFSISEHEYDEDAAGDWYRTFSHISVTVPAVRGPYSNVNVELTQLSGEIRRKADDSTDAAEYAHKGINDSRFKRDLTSGERIATNSGLQDDGTVGERENQEILPPFAGSGAVSTFRIELKPEHNHFDRHSVTDVILHLTINSRYGGENACIRGMEARRMKLAEDPSPVMLPLHSAFSNAWHQFTSHLSNDVGAELMLKFEESHIPMHLLPARRIVQTNLYFAYPKGQEEAQLDLVDTNVGEFSRPEQLRELVPAEGGPLPALYIRRLKLRRPFSLSEENRIGFRRAIIPPKRAWIISWVEGAAL